MQPKKLSLDETLLVLRAQAEVMRFKVRGLIAALEKENLPDLLALLEAEYQKKFGKPFKEN
jgi:hypothetical protein